MECPGQDHPGRGCSNGFGNPLSKQTRLRTGFFFFNPRIRDFTSNFMEAVITPGGSPDAGFASILSRAARNLVGFDDVGRSHRALVLGKQAFPFFSRYLDVTVMQRVVDRRNQ